MTNEDKLEIVKNILQPHHCYVNAAISNDGIIVIVQTNYKNEAVKILETQELTDINIQELPRFTTLF